MRRKVDRGVGLVLGGPEGVEVLHELFEVPLEFCDVEEVSGRGTGGCKKIV